MRGQQEKNKNKKVGKITESVSIFPKNKKTTLTRIIMYILEAHDIIVVDGGHKN